MTCIFFSFFHKHRQDELKTHKLFILYYINIIFKYFFLKNYKKIKLKNNYIDLKKKEIIIKMTTNEFKDIVLIDDDDSEIMKEQQKQMNLSKSIKLNQFYPEGFNCICNRKVKNIKSHILSSRHKRFCNKNGIIISIKPPEPKEKKEKKKYVYNRKIPKELHKKKGRPRIHPKDETIEQKRTRYKKYTMYHLDKSIETREKHNSRVAKFREANRELCRQRVYESRRKKRLEAEMNKV